MSDITEILREFNIPLLVASENGPTNAEIAMADEIERLRARVEVLERALSGIVDFCEEGHRQPYVAIANTARAALKETAP